MPDDSEKRQQHSNHATRHVQSTTPGSRRSYGSYQTGEPSKVADEAYTPADDSTLNTSSFSESRVTGKQRQTAQGEQRHGTYRPRPSGGFLLSKPLFGEQSVRSNGVSRDDGRRRSRIPVNSRRSESPTNAKPEKNGADVAILPDDFAVTTRRTSSSERKQGPNGRPASASKIPSPRPDSAYDFDSTQIVSMALNLSESRRIAQRRNISSPVPPRLAQLPDSPAGGHLKQHLQQQRRISRTMSPKPDGGGLTPRNVSVSYQRLSSPLQASFDPDSSYTYHFSSSTLDRAQSAKEHFELMAQYRRLLHLVPPFDTSNRTSSRPSTSSPPASPNPDSTPTSFRSAPPVSLGRPYNPLQYIRNRKVRARERKAIDGQAQGFKDVQRVTDWVDQAATFAATTSPSSDSTAVPPFSGVRTIVDPNPPSNIPVPASNMSRAKRPRVDWVIEPADMLADLYWVEQDDNKSLMENRHYARMFPKKWAAIPRAASQGTNEAIAVTPELVSKSHGEVESSGASAELTTPDPGTASKADTDPSHASTRNRARKKLHELRAFHHRHNSSVHSHRDFLHLRKSSFSDTSDSDVDRRTRDRSGTISADSKALLEKQMNDMLAREAVKERVEIPRDGQSMQSKSFQPTTMTPDRSYEASAEGQSRREPRTDSSHSHDRTDQQGHPGLGSPTKYTRPSLEVPRWSPRASVDLDTSLPPSPDLKASTDRSNYIPTIGMDLSSPRSRHGSPGRNAFSKVKSMFRERSRERGTVRKYTDKDDKLESPIERNEQDVLSPASIKGPESPDRWRSRSPAPRMPRADTGKSHKSMGSLKFGKDDQIGLRNLLKGSAKIDGVIRGGVSKVSDFLWKKEQDADISTSTSSDESEAEPARGRLRTANISSRSSSIRPHERHQVKHYLDMMPPFKSASELDKSASPEADGLIVPLQRPSRPPSRRSSRFDILKPPRIDIRNASRTASPTPGAVPRYLQKKATSRPSSRSRDSVVSVESARKSSNQLNAILSLPPPTSRPRQSSGSRPRHWSISDRTLSPQRRSALSKREVSRLRTLALSSGIKAMEIARRANESHYLSNLDHTNTTGLPWADISPIVPSAQMSANSQATQLDAFPITARLLASGIESSATAFEKSAQRFANEDMRALRARADSLHARVATDLIDRTRRAADEADECSRDVVDTQRLKVKRVVDIIDKMLRRRRRRFRWVRRGGWLLVEWLLVGIMWYVWFMVVILNVFLGIGRGGLGAVRWLLWL